MNKKDNSPMLQNRHPEIEPDEQNPFGNNDLGRKQHAENFECIVSLYAKTGCVMALNGAWGTGKTTFVKMLKTDMANKGFRPLYFNAWTNDFVSDPLVALLAELKELHQDDEKYKNLVKLGGKIVIDVLAAIFKSILKNKAGIDYESLTDGLAETFKGEIDQYAEQQKSLEDFKKALTEYVADNSGNGPVVFFIDELDRCNPRFAVQVLERVKHLFDIPNMVFVLVINKDQLRHAIRGYYGSDNIDADNYLRRFIDIEYQLPEVDKEKFFEMLYEEYGFDDILASANRDGDYDLKRESDYLQTLMRTLVKYSDFDLRTTDKYMAHTRLALQSYSNSEHFYSGVLAIMSYLRFANNEIYEKIKDHQWNANELLLKLDEEFGSMLQKAENSDSTKNNLLGALARTLYTYDPKQLDGTFYQLTNQYPTRYIKVEELKPIIMSIAKICPRGAAEMTNAIEHLELLRNVKMD